MYLKALIVCNKFYIRNNNKKYFAQKKIKNSVGETKKIASNMLNLFDVLKSEPGQ